MSGKRYGAEIHIGVSLRENGQFTTGGQISRARYIKLDADKMADLEIILDELDEFLSTRIPQVETCEPCSGSGHVTTAGQQADDPF